MENKIRIFNYRNVLNTIFFILFSCSAFYCLVGVRCFGSEPLKVLPSWEIVFYGLLAFSFFLTLIIFNKKANNYRISLTIFFIHIILFFTNIIAICMMKSPSIFSIEEGNIVTQFVYAISDSTRFVFIIQFSALLMVSFFLLDLLPKIYKTYNFVYVVSFLVILFVMVCVIYSFISDYEVYMNAIEAIIHKKPVNASINSFFPNKNSYALIVFIGLAASLFLHQRKGHFWWLIFALFFTFSIMITYCKLLTIIAPITLLTYLIIRFFYTFKKHPILNVITLIASVVALLTISFVFALIERSHPNYVRYLLEVFFHNRTEYDAFEARVAIWVKAFQLLDHYRYSYAIGLGYNVFGDYLAQYMQYGGQTSSIFVHAYSHNGFLELLGNGGLFLVFSFTFLLFYVVILGIKYFKQNKMIVILSYLIIISMFAEMAVESGTFIFPYSPEFAFAGVIIYVPILNINYRNKQNILEVVR